MRRMRYHTESRMEKKPENKAPPAGLNELEVLNQISSTFFMSSLQNPAKQLQNIPDLLKITLNRDNRGRWVRAMSLCQEQSAHHRAHRQRCQETERPELQCGTHRRSTTVTTEHEPRRRRPNQEIKPLAPANQRNICDCEEGISPMLAAKQKTRHHLNVTIKHGKMGCQVRRQRRGKKRDKNMRDENDPQQKRPSVAQNNKAHLTRADANGQLQDEGFCSVFAGTQTTHHRLKVILQRVDNGWRARDEFLSQEQGTQARSQHRGHQEPNYSILQRCGQKRANNLRDRNEPQQKKPNVTRTDTAHLEEMYQVGQLLGKGGFGSVYAGTRKADGLPVAIKFVSKGKACEELQTPGHGLLPTEVALMTIASTNPSCSNILQLLEWYEEPTCYIMILERPEPCEDLDEFYRNHGGFLNESVARYVMHQLIQALKHCKSCGILHRDVKPRNILIQKDTLKVKLFDFGCGDFIRHSYKTFLGTVPYAPPEWFRKRRYRAEPATVWSLGVMLFELVCGSLPFKSRKDIKSGSIHFTKSLSEDCIHLIRWCLSTKASYRPRLEQIEHHIWFKRPGRHKRQGQLHGLT